MKILLALAVSMFPTIALALPITFDLRNPAIELIDEVNSFSLTQNGLVATLAAKPPTFNEPPLRTLELNQTASSFGINVVNTTCGGLEESALIDSGCTPESVAIIFNLPVRLDQIVLSFLPEARQEISRHSPSTASYRSRFYRRRPRPIFTIFLPTTRFPLGNPLSSVIWQATGLASTASL